MAKAGVTVTEQQDCIFGFIQWHTQMTAYMESENGITLTLMTRGRFSEKRVPKGV
jgi:hypothetical protein